MLDAYSMQFILRMGAGGPADVNFARVAVSSMASTAKEKCLPVLQASQDVFSNWPQMMFARPAVCCITDLVVNASFRSEVCWQCTSICVARRLTVLPSCRSCLIN